MDRAGIGTSRDRSEQMRVTQNGPAALQVMRRLARPVPPVSRSVLDG